MTIDSCLIVMMDSRKGERTNLSPNSCLWLEMVGVVMLMVMMVVMLLLMMVLNLRKG